MPDGVGLANNYYLPVDHVGQGEDAFRWRLGVVFLDEGEEDGVVEGEEEGRVGVEVHLHQEGKQGRLVDRAHQLMQHLIHEPVFQLQRVANPQPHCSRLPRPLQLPTMPLLPYPHSLWALSRPGKN